MARKTVAPHVQTPAAVGWPVLGDNADLFGEFSSDSSLAFLIMPAQ
jgi:hypothetical protein